MIIALVKRTVLTQLFAPAVYPCCLTPLRDAAFKVVAQRCGFAVDKVAGRKIESIKA
jgi:hypothetical protein